MTNRLINLTIKIVLICGFIIGNYQIYAQSNKVLSDEVIAVLTFKLLAFEKNLSNSPKDLIIYVLDAPGVAEELKKGIGKKIGEATLKNVIKKGDTLPRIPDVIYIGEADVLDAAIQYSRANKIPSVTGVPELIDKGVTLGIGVSENNKPVIFLNLSSSALEDLDWNPAILKFAKTFR